MQDRTELRDLLARSPTPLAQLVRRVLNARPGAEHHAAAFYVLEATLKLGASARITLACRGQKGVLSMNWMCLRHHQLLHSRPVRSLYAHAQPRRSPQSLNVQTPGGLELSARSGGCDFGRSTSCTVTGSWSDMASAGGWAAAGLGM